MRIGVAGFFGYAKYVLNLDNGPAFVPFLHSNQSSLEAWFSLVRSKNRDTPQGYRGAVGAMDKSRGKQALANNKCYSADDVEETPEEETGANQLERVFGRRDKARDTWLNELQSSQLEHTEIDLPCFSTAASSDQELLGTAGSLAVSKLREQHLSKHFGPVLLEFSDFSEIAWASMFTSSQGFFERLYQMNDEEHESFDRACKTITDKLLAYFEMSIIADTSAYNSYYLQIFRCLQSDTIDKARELAPEGMRDRQPWCLVGMTLGEMFVKWVLSAMDKVHQELVKNAGGNTKKRKLPSVAVSVEDSNAEVNRIFGWAIRDVLRKKISLDDGELSEEESDKNSAWSHRLYSNLDEGCWDAFAWHSTKKL